MANHHHYDNNMEVFYVDLPFDILNGLHTKTAIAITNIDDCEVLSINNDLSKIKELTKIFK